MNIQFYCRSSKADKKGFAPVELAITLDGKRVFIQLPRKERPEDFKKFVAAKRSNDLKDFLEVMRVNVNKAITDLARSGMPLTSDSLKNYLKNGGSKVYSVEDLFNEHYAIILRGAKKEYVRKYEAVRDMFYMVVNRGQIGVTNANVLDFQREVYSRYEESTAYNKMYLLKATIDFALANRMLEHNPFTGIKLQKPKEVIEYLTDQEVEQLQQLELSPRLERVRDIFLFQAGSGLAYADMIQLSPEDIAIEEGVYYISKTRQKTKVAYTSVLLPIAIEVLKKYNYQLPRISNQKLNTYLKEIDSKLHSHLARKTYCTKLINSGVRLDIVSKCAGHSNTKVTSAIYAHLQRNTILKEVARAL